MKLSREFMLERVYASDKTYNGRFLTGVLSTGIYCLPSCTARKPKAENVRFFETEAEAQAAGLRACRRCRPDDFYRQHDPDVERLTGLAERICREPGAFADVPEMAAASDMGATKLHSLFRRHYHLTPAEFLNRARVAAACGLLARSSSSAPTALETAFEVGYASLSAFNENFRRLTGLSPTEYRRLGTEAGFTLSLPRDYLAAYTLRLQGRDAQSLSERVVGNRLIKAIRLGEGSAQLHLEFCPEQVHARVETAPAATPEEMRAAHAVAVRLLGLLGDPAPFEKRLETQGEHLPLLGARRGLRIPLTADLCEALVWAIVGQQIGLSFAYALRRRLTELCGERLDDGLFVPPPAAQVARLDTADLTRLQFSQRKAEYLLETARSIVSGDLPLETFADGMASAAEKRLLAVRGLGPWAANYILMRGCGFADCVPVGDSGLRTALRRYYTLDAAPDPAQVLALMEPFTPYRSFATQHLWMSLGEPA